MRCINRQHIIRRNLHTTIRDIHCSTLAPNIILKLDLYDLQFSYFFLKFVLGQFVEYHLTTAARKTDENKSNGIGTAESYMIFIYFVHPLYVPAQHSSLGQTLAKMRARVRPGGRRLNLQI